MTLLLTSAAFALLSRLDPERAHRVALAALRAGLAGRADAADDPLLASEVFGLRFANPIGLAAGFDKDAVAVLPLLRLGFGCIEAGGVTPCPQAGNPRPRLFRLPADRAVINRMGLNGRGIEAFVAEIAGLSRRTGVLGVNVAINKEGSAPERDYPALVKNVAPYADYVAINVSSPNTPGLRDLQGAARLRAILTAIAASVPNRPPILVKIAPDLSDDGLAALIEAAVAGGATGLIVGNTTTSRPPGLRSKQAAEAGGLSGAPLYTLSTALLARAFLLVRGRLTLIGCGGVSNGTEALGKIRAGASLVQLYTAFAYAGPALIPRIKTELATALRAGGFASVQAAVGTGAEKWSA
ncbi:MAG: quinone-dependent dihydroorotate dehydrogenase [Acetobacteraceae bacterium]